MWAAKSKPLIINETLEQSFDDFEKDQISKIQVSLPSVESSDISTTSLNVQGSSTLFDTLINGTLGVTGISTFKNNVIIQRNGTIQLDLLVNGSTQLNGTLTTLGDVSISSDLNVNGISTLTGDVKVDSTTNSTSTTTGALIVNGGIGVGGDMYLGNNLTIANSSTANSFIIDNITNTTEFKTNATSDYTLTFPISQGGVNESLINDGFGNLSWASINNKDVHIENGTSLTLTNSNDIVEFTSTLTTTTTLPLANSLNKGKIFLLIKTGLTGDLVINSSGSDKIDNNTDISIILSIQYSKISITNTGNGIWYTI